MGANEQWRRERGAALELLGFDTLILSIATPPSTVDETVAVAWQHYLYCSRDRECSELQARSIFEAPTWFFWWD